MTIYLTKGQRIEINLLKVLKMLFVAITFMFITMDVYSQKATPSPDVNNDSSDETSVMPIMSVITGLGNEKATLVSYFTHLPNPRTDRCKEHLPEDIIFITLSPVICGAETWNETEDYSKAKEEWLRQYLRLPNGIPSHDTFNRFFSATDPLAFEEAFISRIRAVSELTEGEVVSIGKTVRGSRDKGGKHAIHAVSARANANRLSPGQVKVNEKSNEIIAIPRLLDVPALKGCVVTIDAMGCERDIAEKTVQKKRIIYWR
jgi:hypothetical protein